MEETIEKVREEMQRQNEKWGLQNHYPVEWLAILSEEVGEVAKEVVEYNFSMELKHIDAMKKELIQVAAVAIQAILSIDRKYK